MAPSLVSCVIPVFNGERYLAEALDSVFAQTHRPIEVIVVDDGSTDGTAAILGAYADRIEIVRQRNAGPAAARNAGIARASGHFITFLDGDDLWHPERIERTLERFAVRLELDYCACHVENFLSPELVAQGATLSDEAVQTPIAGYMFASLMLRRSVLDKVGGLDTSRSHTDSTDWILRANAAGAVHELLPDVLLRRRLHGGNWSQRHTDRSHDEFLTLVKSHLDRKRGR